MKKRIVFVGQPEYFRCLVHNDLDKEYEVAWYQVDMTNDPIASHKRYSGLLHVDCDIMFFFRGEFVPRGILDNINKKIIKVQLSSEPIPGLITSLDREKRMSMLMANMNQFDYFFHYDKTSIPYLKEKGFHVDGEFIFPVAIEMYKPLQIPCKVWDVGFFGRSTRWREDHIIGCKRDFNFLHVAHGVIGQEFVDMINLCRIGLNLHVDNLPSLEHRMQNMMACGVPVISEPLTHNDCLIPGKHFIEVDTIKDPNAVYKAVEYYLDHPFELLKISKSGQAFVRKEMNSLKQFRELIEGLKK